MLPTPGLLSTQRYPQARAPDGAFALLSVKSTITRGTEINPHQVELTAPLAVLSADGVWNKTVRFMG